MAFLKPGVSKRIKIQISKDEQKLNYDLTDEQGVSYPLQLGNDIIMKQLSNSFQEEVSRAIDQFLNIIEPTYFI